MVLAASNGTFSFSASISGRFSLYCVLYIRLSSSLSSSFLLLLLLFDFSSCSSSLAFFLSFLLLSFILLLLVVGAETAGPVAGRHRLNHGGATIVSEPHDWCAAGDFLAGGLFRRRGRGTFNPAAHIQPITSKICFSSWPT